jgi:hypothetical protein
LLVRRIARLPPQLADPGEEELLLPPIQLEDLGGRGRLGILGTPGAMQRVQRHSDGVRKIERRELPAGRDVDEQVASGEFLPSQPVVFGTEHQRDPTDDRS